MAIFVDAYNRYGKAKQLWREAHDKGEVPFSLLDYLWSVHLVTAPPGGGIDYAAAL